MCLPMEEGIFWFDLYHVIILLILLTQREKLSFGVKFKLETPFDHISKPHSPVQH